MSTPKVSYQIAARMRGHILAGGLSKGDRLPSEHQLTKETRASRASVREALQILIGQGLVEARPGKGYYVRGTAAGSSTSQPPSTKEIQDLTEARLVIECEAAALAATRATPQDLAGIDAFLAHMETKAASGAYYWPDAVVLHLMIAQTSHNQVLSDLLEVIMRKLSPHAEKVQAEIPDRASLDTLLHRDLWTAIKSRDPEAARAAMEYHVRYAGSLYMLPYELEGSLADSETSPPTRVAAPDQPSQEER